MPNNKKKQKNKQGKVLIIDDEMMIREMYKDILEAENLKVDVAANGKEGLNKLDKKNYDMVLLDIMMPVMDGMTMLANLKEKPPKKKQGAIMVLTNASPVMFDDIRHAYEGKMPEERKPEIKLLDCIVKSSISPQQVVEKVKQAIKQKS
ncbi:MAG: response regulator [Candidatus Moranbacteria bacterium]|nr:response regulator [Candidatus Moranbacteria bacterium]